MSEREQKVKESIALMIETRDNLTGKGYPELPALKNLCGYSDVTGKERDQWSEEYIRMNTGGTPEKVEGPTPPKHLPTNLYHPSKPTRQVLDMDDWIDAREEGYKDLREFPDDVAEEIHRKGRDTGLHLSQKVRS